MTEQSRDRERKSMHNQAEKKRVQAINDRVSSLHDLLTVRISAG